MILLVSSMGNGIHCINQASTIKGQAPAIKKGFVFGGHGVIAPELAAAAHQSAVTP